MAPSAVSVRPVAAARPLWQPGGVIRVRCGRRFFPTNTESTGHILVMGWPRVPMLMATPKKRKLFSLLTTLIPHNLEHFWMVSESVTTAQLLRLLSRRSGDDKCVSELRCWMLPSVISDDTERAPSLLQPRGWFNGLCHFSFHKMTFLVTFVETSK